MRTSKALRISRDASSRSEVGSGGIFCDEDDGGTKTEGVNSASGRLCPDFNSAFAVLHATAAIVSVADLSSRR